MPVSKSRVVVDLYLPTDFDVVKKFVESIQEHERAAEQDLRPGQEIGAEYTQVLIDAVADLHRQGVILMARVNNSAIGFACARIDIDDDLLLREEARLHAYVSDIFVDEAWRRQGVARLLLQSIEAEMCKRGCQRIRICTKAANHSAVRCYEATGYRPYEIILTKEISE